MKGSAFNAEVLLRVVNHGLMISFIPLTCTDGQQLNKQYDYNDFQVDVPVFTLICYHTLKRKLTEKYAESQYFIIQ